MTPSKEVSMCLFSSKNMALNPHICNLKKNTNKPLMCTVRKTVAEGAIHLWVWRTVSDCRCDIRSALNGKCPHLDSAISVFVGPGLLVKCKQNIVVPCLLVKTCKGACGCVVYICMRMFISTKVRPLDYNKRKENKNKLYQHLFLLV